MSVTLQRRLPDALQATVFSDLQIANTGGLRFASVRARPMSVRYQATPASAQSGPRSFSQTRTARDCTGSECTASGFVSKKASGYIVGFRRQRHVFSLLKTCQVLGLLCTAHATPVGRTRHNRHFLAFRQVTLVPYAPFVLCEDVVALMALRNWYYAFLRIPQYKSPRTEPF